MPGSTTVSGTVTDTGGQTWNNGTISFRFIPAPNFTGTYGWTGGAFNPLTTYDGALNSVGHYSVSVPDNNTITPSGTSWEVTVTSQATFPAFNSSSIISGASQTLNITPGAIQVAAGANNCVYATSEVIGASVGSQIYVIGTGLKTFDGSVWAFAGGGGTTLTVASGTAVLGTSLIASGAKASTVTVVATGALTTDNVMADFNSDPTGVTGYVPSAFGMLTIIKFCTAGNVNFIVINNTASGITPGAITLNWRVVR